MHGRRHPARKKAGHKPPTLAGCLFGWLILLPLLPVLLPLLVLALLMYLACVGIGGVAKAAFTKPEDL